ncbi:MAG: hypothetical protein M3R66_17595 [Actinomycetota bacterium]|jgi:hypothetical protein|nr:hypothetical protein [Actinomycetota bacterium]
MLGAGEQAQQCRLAGAVLPDEPDPLAGGGEQVDAVEDTQTLASSFRAWAAACNRGAAPAGEWIASP